MVEILLCQPHLDLPTLLFIKLFNRASQLNLVCCFSLGLTAYHSDSCEVPQSTGIKFHLARFMSADIETYIPWGYDARIVKTIKT